MDRVLRHAIAQGLPPVTAIQMATINTAEHFGLEPRNGHDRPGRWADILLVRDLADFQAEVVIARGQVVAEGGACWSICRKLATRIGRCVDPPQAAAAARRISGWSRPPTASDRPM
jgi:adenine deaminase